ncbi:hypothetical protein NW759_016206 [Fusarium solani]|nr:hypothetical protein NW759_016206 [Fusarium solani]
MQQPESDAVAGSGSPPEQQQQQADDHTGRVQERNRIASNKFRVKKREDAARLKSDEEDMERLNRDLATCVADLTLEVYNLKMRLLQHTDCDCALIQSYIANEANRYIKDLGTHQHPSGSRIPGKPTRTELIRLRITNPRPYLMSDICQRLRNGDESAKNAIICHATGEQMDSRHRCDQCDDHDPLLGGGRVVQKFFLGACSNCYQGCQISVL